MSQQHQIKFQDKHDLDLYIYDGSDAEIRYSTLFVGQYTNEDEGEPREIAPSKQPGDEERQQVRMGVFPIFGGPVQLSWYDLDNNLIEYNFTFDEIFPDRVIPHPTELDDRIFWPEPLVVTPGILLEINNRTLTICTLIDLRVQVPDSDRVEIVPYRAEIWSRTF